MNEPNLDQKLIIAYDNMMAHVAKLLDNAEQKALPTLHKNIDKAKIQSIELKQITKEEAEKLAYYIGRDLEDAAHYLEQTGDDLSTWISFDLELVEQRLWDVFSKVADKSRIEFAQLKAQAKRAQEYHTGEITSIGTLACHHCDSLVHFKKTSRIPPCAKCHHTVFVRTRRH
jgi:hypothetical protein